MSTDAIGSIKGDIEQLRRILNAVEAGTATRKEKSSLSKVHKSIALGFDLLERAIFIAKSAPQESSEPTVKLAREIASAYLKDPESTERELEKLRKMISELDREVKSAQAKIKGEKGV
jgi:predicted RNase H-like nuclease (RuvC/YqgF family)